MENETKEYKKCCYEQPPVRELLNTSKGELTVPFPFHTVHRSSYLPHDLSQLASFRGKTFRPEPNLRTNSGIPMEKDTVMNLSYQPTFPIGRNSEMWDPNQSESIQPYAPMASETVYRESYGLPGRFVECDEQNMTKNMMSVYAQDCDENGISVTKAITKHNGL